MPALDPIPHLTGFVTRAHQRLVNDFNALPEDKRNVSPGGVARTPVNIVAECATVNERIAAYLQTGEANRPSPEELGKHIASFDTPETALAYLNTATAKVLEVIATLDIDTLGDEVRVMRFPMTKFALVELVAHHMLYHDGQITYLQTLYGDAESHW